MMNNNCIDFLQVHHNFIISAQQKAHTTPPTAANTRYKSVSHNAGPTKAALGSIIQT